MALSMLIEKFLKDGLMSNKVKVIWSTPNGEDLIAHMARVSAPANQEAGTDSSRLIKYLVKHKHWSPFEMVNVCMEIETTRDIARQILRHRSFSFQEFSQRYAEVQGYSISEARLQDTKNRQNSLETADRELQEWWTAKQREALFTARMVYDEALAMGIAKEVARKVLPEGNTMSKMYMNGTLRSWMHYVDIRCDAATQKEHRDVALKCKEELIKLFPNIGV
jgi:thymidylate synthase (FAD)